MIVALAAPASAQEAEQDAGKQSWFTGDFVLQYGVRSRSRPRDVGTKSASYAAPLSFWMQLSERVSVEVDVDTVLSFEDRKGRSVTGFGDTYLTAQFDPILEEGRRPFVGVAYSIKAPTASTDRGLGSGAVDHNPYVVIGKTIATHTFAEAAVGGYFEGVPETGGYNSFGTLSLGIRRKFPPRFAYRGVVTATTAGAGLDATVSSRHRFDVRLSDDFVLVGGVTAGLTPNVPRFGWLAGVRWEANFRELFR